MLPFKSEPLEILKGRFPKALEKEWTLAEIPRDRPGLHREHVFDFASGVRLLISRDNFYPHIHGGPVTHVSASFEFDPPLTIDVLMTKVKDHYLQLGGVGNLKFLGFSSVVGGKGIPHWIVEHAKEEVHNNRS